MRLTRIGWLALAALLFCAALLSFAYLHRTANEYKLSDGSVLRLEKVYYGKPEPFDYDGWLGRIKKRLPPKFINFFSKPPTTTMAPFRGKSTWYMNAPINTNNDALYVYVTRHDPSTGKLVNVGFTAACLEDEHGCILQCTQVGGEDDGRLASPSPRMGGPVASVNWFRFEAFPRHERRLHLKLLENMFPSRPVHPPKPLEFVINNPAFGTTQKNDWTPKPLPVISTNGGVTFMLTGVSIRDVTNGPYRNQMEPYHIEPTFSSMENGQISSNWQALDMELYDGSGNFSGTSWAQQKPFLCPHEDLWKLRARFFGSEQSRFASNTTWTLHRIEIPGAGQFTNLHSSQTVDGVYIDAMFFAGTGEFDYSSDGEIINHASPLKESMKENAAQWTGPGADSPPLREKSPHLTFKVTQTNQNQRLTVRARDEQGRSFYGYTISPWFTPAHSDHASNEANYLQRTYGPGNAEQLAFDLPPDSKKIDLTFCVHNCRIAEFVFKPPTQLTSSVTNTVR